ncbi:glycosyltransferase family 2 protein [Streptomyces wuyuanensis]|uniref:glycosyltransferase family 2 protein n=1 Tax=Streptomyces wuyuanensis TaxID=1196353 RepID=UPI003423D896
MRPPRATAIVVTYNSAAHIDNCLRHLLEAGLTVRVVDNASSDNTNALVAAGFPKVALISNPFNAGFAAAVNQALAETDTDIVLLVNPDCIVSPTTVHALICTLRSDAGVGITGPRLTSPDGRHAVSAHPFESWFVILASRFGGGLLPLSLRRLLCGGRRRAAYDASLEPGPPLAVDWVSGACMAVRTSVLRDVGGLDEGYFMYYEDEELCLQTWRRGLRVLYVPAVAATHVGGASSHDPSWLWPHLYRSLLRFFARHRSGSYQVVRGIVLVRAVLGVVLAVARRPGREMLANPRARAWTHVARIAFSATPLTLTAASHGNGALTCTSSSRPSANAPSTGSASSRR